MAQCTVENRLPPATRAPPAPPCDPPSIRVVLEVLHARQRVTGAQLRVDSGLPRRTVYHALRVLCARGTVLRRTSLRDTRQTYFWLNQQASSAAIQAASPTPRARPAQAAPA